jgi:hypothetical protein
MNIKKDAVNKQKNYFKAACSKRELKSRLVLTKKSRLPHGLLLLADLFWCEAANVTGLIEVNLA